MQTNSEPSTGIIIKSNRGGRVRYTDEFKREVLAAYESSSLSGPDFARQCGSEVSDTGRVGLVPQARQAACRRKDRSDLPRRRTGVVPTAVRA